jgi:AraC-like DNA-binding protein
MSSTLTDFLNNWELRGRTWCIVEIRSSGGISVPASDAVYYYAVLKGACRLAGVGKSSIELRPGDACIVLSGQAHALRTRSNSIARNLQFFQDDEEVDTPPCFTIGDEGPVVARLLCGKLIANWPTATPRPSLPPLIKLDCFTASASPWAERIRSLESYMAGSGAAALLTRVADLTLTITLRTHPQCPALFEQSAMQSPINHALQLITDNPSAAWSVAKLAHEVGMSRSTFAGRFRAELGRTPMDVILEQRMRQALNLLQNTEIKIADISVRTGYSSEAAFSRRFMQFFGARPGQMRRMRRNRSAPQGKSEAKGKSHAA